MTRLNCLDSDHATPLSVQLALDGARDRTAAILGTGNCPACPDVHLTAARGGVQVCPCCWSAWWSEAGEVRCTPGAVVVEEPAVRARQAAA